MALDHYISQVHLRNFYSPTDNLLNAIRKRDLKRFKTRSEDICRIEDGSTNSYLGESRVIEEFLKTVEPHYNTSLTKLQNDAIDQLCVYTIAGFVAFVASCSPTGMRTHAQMLKAIVEAESTLLDRQGILGKSPPELGGKSLTELLADGTVHVSIDEKFPQANAVLWLAHYLSIFGNAQWEIIRNDEGTRPFLTCDYPTTIESNFLGFVNRVVPLSPKLAVRIIPNPALSRTEPDLSFSRFSYRSKRATLAEIEHINTLVVQCAEDLVLTNFSDQWIEELVSTHRNCRLEGLADKIPDRDGILTITRLRVVGSPAP